MTKELVAKVEKEWGGKLLLSPGTEHSKGTAILLKNDLKYEVSNIHESYDNRILLCNIKTNDKHITLINIYAPNVVSERKAFFNKLQKWISKYSLNEQEIIVGGISITWR